MKGIDVPVRYKKGQTEIDRIADAAIAWQARLASPGALAADYEAFSQWIGEDSRHADAFGRAERAAMMVECARAEFLATGAQQPRFIPETARNDNVGFRRAAIAASVALIAAASLVFFISRPGGVETVASAAPAGRIVTAALSDGTQITLAPGAEFKGTFTNARREISNLSGTSFFSVSHDAARPFIISLGERTITVVGTKFEVKAGGNSQSVTVLDGIVSITTDSQNPALERRLIAGDRVTYSGQSQEGIFDRPASEDVAEWRDGTLEFDRADAQTITEKLNGFYGRAVFDVDPDSPPALSFSGALSLSDPLTTARRLEELTPVIARDVDGIFVLSDR